MDIKENLAPQFRAILGKYTKSIKIDEMVEDLISCVIRESPVVTQEKIVSGCQHIFKISDSYPLATDKHLICKFCNYRKEIEK